jgi:hypothetical protein
MSESQESEMVRHAVLECLVLRHPAALPVAGIVRRCKTTLDFEPSSAGVDSALAMLQDLGLVKSQYDELGGSQWWSATAQGLLKKERG